MDVMGSCWLLISLVHVLLGNCIFKMLPTGCGSLGLALAIRVLLARLTFPGEKVMLQLCSAPRLNGLYLVKVG